MLAVPGILPRWVTSVALADGIAGIWLNGGFHLKPDEPGYHCPCLSYLIREEKPGQTRVKRSCSRAVVAVTTAGSGLAHAWIGLYGTVASGGQVPLVASTGDLTTQWQASGVYVNPWQVAGISTTGALTSGVGLTNPKTTTLRFTSSITTVPTSGTSLPAYATAPTANAALCPFVGII